MKLNWSNIIHLLAIAAAVVFFAWTILSSTGCRTAEPMGIEERNGIDVKTTKHNPTGLLKLLGADPTYTYEEIKSHYQETMDGLHKWAFWLMIGSGMVGLAAVGMAIAFHSPFTVALAKKIGIICAVVFIASLAVSALANWLLWILVAIVILGCGWYIHKSRDWGVDKVAGEYVKPGLAKLKETLNGG